MSEYRWADSIVIGCFTANLVSHCLYPNVRVLTPLRGRTLLLQHLKN